MIDELELLKRNRPEVGAPSPEARRAAERALEAAMAGGSPRVRRRLAQRARVGLGRLAAVAAVLVVVGVVLVVAAGHTRRPGASAVPSGPQLEFTAKPTGGRGGVRPGEVARAATLLQRLIATVPGAPRGARVTSTGDRLTVHLGSSARRSQPELLRLTGVTGRLVFYDWEANALTPTGQSVASALSRQDPNALLISQGGGSAAPGMPGGGALPLYAAVRLASRQPSLSATTNGRPGPQYYAFGAPGGRACAVAARYYETAQPRGTPCYLAGPAPSAAQALSWLPPGVAPGAAMTLVVPQGTVILLAAPTTNFLSGAGPSDALARFYVLLDRVGLFGSVITNPHPSTDASGSPDIAFGFTARGAATFQRVTARVAHRGTLISGLGQTLNQHFAVALGDQLLTVPSIDFKTYPEGIPGGNGADLTGGYTSSSVGVVNEEIELGALPITLELAASSVP